ncbi:integrase arm-type DNA-binding domain-containing protein [Candidatus Schmidhempelia bombi]|uniref:integrase arm-type DNA-binding domain-containing protein n=1 Tax=Candidatus Schmidhempelia bombi TaxID=1505866 RepID=UPI001930FDB2
MPIYRIPKIILARKTHPLTDTQIKAAKPRNKDYSLFDGGGMYLLVKSNNCKIWCFKYTRPYAKKGALISFGSYPEVSLQQARKQRDEAR